MVHNKTVRFLSIVLSLLLIVTLMPLESSAAVSKAGSPSLVSSLTSSYDLDGKQVKITAKGSKLYINYETPKYASKYSINVRKVSPKASSKSKWIKYVKPKKQKDGTYKFSTYITAKKIGSAGSYVLVITKKPGSSTVYKNCCFRVKKGKVYILQYPKIKSANSSAMKKASSYSMKTFSDPYMKDIRSLVFRNPKTKKVASVTDKKVAYFKKVSNIVTKGADSDYEKALKIYEYVGKTFYYDTYGNSTGKNQYHDPYRNLYNHRNKKSSANSTSKGKVGVTCLGYSAMVIALCRAQGIPARLVGGHHISLSKYFHNWSTEKNISKRDHWWVQAYVDGHWIDIDACTASSNKWYKKSKKWVYTGLTNYIYFDPSNNQLATSHQITTIKH